MLITDTAFFIQVNGVTEEINKLSWKELYKLNLPDWYWVLFGVIGSAILGAFYPLLSILFSEILRVSHYQIRSLSVTCCCGHAFMKFAENCF